MNNLLHPLVEVCQVIVRTSGQAVVMVGIILAMQWLLKNRLSPGWRYGLWCLLVVRLVLPASLESGLSIFNVVKLQRAQRTEATQGMPVTQAIQATEFPGDSGRLPGTPVVSGNSSPAPNSQLSTPSSQRQFPLPRSEPPAIAPQPAREALHLGSWETAALIWLFGVLAFGVRLLWMNLRFRARLRAFEPISDHPSLAVLEECRTALRVRQQVELIESDLVQTPGVYGFWRKRLLIPEGTFERFDRSELRCIFLHELAHLRRRDLEINWLATLLQVLHWFNPVLWFAFGRMRTDRELATDSLALSVAAPAPVTLYGETIIRVLEGFSGRTALPGVVGIAENLNHIKQRMKAIAQFGTNKYSKWMVAAIALTLALVTLTDAQPAGSAQAPGAIVQSGGSNAPASLAPAVSNPATLLPDDVLNTTVSTNNTPSGADASYVEAVKVALAAGGPEIELLSVRVGASGEVTYTFTDGTPGQAQTLRALPESSGLAPIGKIEVTPARSAEPQFFRPGLDSRRPIVLSDWNISWQKARDIALAGGEQVGGEVLDVLLYGSSAPGNLFWKVTLGSPGGFGSSFPHRIDATTGEIVTQKRSQLSRIRIGLDGPPIVTPGGTDIRVRNGTLVEFKNVLVGGSGYGDIKPGEATAYQNWPSAYRYPSVFLLAEQHPLGFQPIDYVGEKVLGAGRFTYLLTIQDGRLRLTLVDDAAVAGLAAQFATETDPATKALKEWLAVFANAPQGGKPPAGPLIEQYGDKLPAIIGQMAVKGDPLIGSNVSGIEQLFAGIGEVIQSLGPRAAPAVSSLLEVLRRVRTADEWNPTAFSRLVELLSRVNVDSPALEGILSVVQGQESYFLLSSCQGPLVTIASRGETNVVGRLDKFLTHPDMDTRLLAAITMLTCCEPTDTGKAVISDFLTNSPTRQTTSYLTSHLKDFKGREKAFLKEIAALSRTTGYFGGVVNLGKDGLRIIGEGLMSDDANFRYRAITALSSYASTWQADPDTWQDIEPFLSAVADERVWTFVMMLELFPDRLKELSPELSRTVRNLAGSGELGSSTAKSLLSKIPPPPAGPP